MTVADDALRTAVALATVGGGPEAIEILNELDAFQARAVALALAGMMHELAGRHHNASRDELFSLYGTAVAVLAEDEQ